MKICSGDGSVTSVRATDTLSAPKKNSSLIFRLSWCLERLLSIATAMCLSKRRMTDPYHPIDFTISKSSWSFTKPSGVRTHEPQNQSMILNHRGTTTTTAAWFIVGLRSLTKRLCWPKRSWGVSDCRPLCWSLFLLKMQIFFPTKFLFERLFDVECNFFHYCN